MELLNILNNRILISDICDKKIAIRISSLELFESMQLQIEEYHIKKNEYVRMLHNDNYHCFKKYDKYIGKTICICIETTVGEYYVHYNNELKKCSKMIGYCDDEWYAEQGYNIVNADDIIFE